jgi:hypothetical protein
MRFRPTGFGGGDAGTLGDSESEEEVLHGTAGLSMPNGLNLPSRKEKRKHTESNGDARAASSKKHRTAEDLQRKEERRAKKEKRRAKA